MQLKHTTAGPHRSADLLHLHRQRKWLRVEEMDLEIPMGVDPEVSLADRHEDRRLSNGVRVEAVKLNPVVIRERSHKVARRHPEPTLAE
jgi:hypothetical protein